jgi:hypothetical protein
MVVGSGVKPGGRAVLMTGSTVMIEAVAGSDVSTLPVTTTVIIFPVAGGPQAARKIP